MKKTNSIEDSIFYKQNLKIQKNLWKPYTIVLLLSIIVILIEGIQ